MIKRISVGVVAIVLLVFHGCAQGRVIPADSPLARRVETQRRREPGRINGGMHTRQSSKLSKERADALRKARNSKTEEECKANHGMWGIWGMGHLLCNPLTSDGRKPCMDSSECEGACVSAAPLVGPNAYRFAPIPTSHGTCSEVLLIYGCPVVWKDGVPTRSMCID